MRNLKHLVAAAALGGLVILPQSSSANPLVAGLTEASLVASEMTSGLVEKVDKRYYGQKRYYRDRYPNRYYRHRYRRYYDNDYYYYPYYVYYPYGYAYPYVDGRFIGGPFIGSGGGWDHDDDDDDDDDN